MESPEARPTYVAPPMLLGWRQRLTRWDLLGMAVGIFSMILCSIIENWRNRYFWYDELATWTLVHEGSVAHMVGSIARGTENNPPLYELLMRGWVAILGPSELSLRLASAVFMSIALVVMWIVLRRAYSTRATAAGVVVTFFSGQVLFDQIGQARFYGFFTACVALAIGATVRAQRRRPGTAGSLALNFVSHLALVFSHVFGGFYSAAILAGSLLSDAFRRRFQWPVYASVVAAWVVFLVWIPATLVQSHMAEPRSWLVRPTRAELFTLVGRQTLWLPLVILFVVLVTLFFPGSTRGEDAIGAEEKRERRLPLVALATAVLAVVPMVFVLSRFAVPVFVDRYMLPSCLGWAIIVAHLADSGSRATHDAGTYAGRRMAGIVWAAWFVSMAQYPIVYALSKFSAGPPGVPLAARFPGVPVVVESALEFWPIHHYAGRDASRYRFLLDWDLAIDSTNSSTAVQEYKLMDLYRREGYLRQGIEQSAEFLCNNRRFLVVNNPTYTWFERRVAADSAFTWSTIGHSGDADVMLVNRRGDSCTPSQAQATGRSRVP